MDLNISVAAYAERWLSIITATVKPRTLASYSQMLRLHVLPSFGQQKARSLHKGLIKEVLAEKLTAGLSRNTVRIIHATLRAMLNSAVDDGIHSSLLRRLVKKKLRR